MCTKNFCLSKLFFFSFGNIALFSYVFFVVCFIFEGHFSVFLYLNFFFWDLKIQISKVTLILETTCHIFLMLFFYNVFAIQKENEKHLNLIKVKFILEVHYFFFLLDIRLIYHIIWIITIVNEYIVIFYESLHLIFVMPSNTIIREKLISRKSSNLRFTIY